MQCCEWGMKPNEFWDCTLLDVAYYLLGNLERERANYQKQKNSMYIQGLIFAKMHAVNLFNSMSDKKARQYPTFEEFFPKDDLQNDNNDSKTFNKIDENNKYEFYKLQKQAYEKMGVKF